jgi:hypothetical protein
MLNLYVDYKKRAAAHSDGNCLTGLRLDGRAGSVSERRICEIRSPTYEIWSERGGARDARHFAFMCRERARDMADLKVRPTTA